jgi:predicted nuclease of restriction endonuclease-like RecB superfamily
MLHTAYKATTTRNAYGDYISTVEVAHACHFREITNILTEANEAIQSDAMAWFEPDSGIEKLDIVKINGTHYRVEKVTKARRLRNPNVLFIKTELLKYGVIS